MSGGERDPAALVRAAYAGDVGGWDRDRDRSLVERGWLARFRALIAPGAPVLDVGCGTGEPIARHLIDAGHPVTGLDAVEAMVELCRARFPGQEWLVGDMRALDLGRRFGGIVAWDSFFHLTAEDQRATIPAFARHLARGGALLLTTGPEAGEAMGRVAGGPVFHASLSPAGYAVAFEAAGLLVRAFVAEDADCAGRSVWLARRRAGSETLANRAQTE